MLKQFVEAWEKGKDGLLEDLQRLCANNNDSQITYEALVRLGWK